MSTEEDVRQASKHFYVALNRMANGDSSLVAEVWSNGSDVTTMHPVGGREVGWDQVRASFEQVAQVASDGTIELKDQRIRIVGDMAYEIGIEQGQFKLAGNLATIEQRVTNIYQRQAGAWKLVHHHADTSPAMVDILKRLQPA